MEPVSADIELAGNAILIEYICSIWEIIINEDFHPNVRREGLGMLSGFNDAINVLKPEQDRYRAATSDIAFLYTIGKYFAPD